MRRSVRRGLGPIARLTITNDTELDTVELSGLHVGRFGRFTYSLSGGVTTSEHEGTLEVVETTVEPPPPLFPLPPSGVIPPPSAIAVPATTSYRSERYALAGELFPTPALGVHVGYARWDGDDALDERYDVGATWFFRRRISVQVAWSKTESRLPIVTVTDVEAVTLQLIGRL
ncbi:MAG TPA: hypothetical protein VF339_16065 [Gammaproteobacteria bacterium]